MLVLSVVAGKLWHFYSAACLAHRVACVSHLPLVIVPLLIPLFSGIC